MSRLWTAQGFGLAVGTFLCFFPRWSHWAEYVFIGCLMAAAGMVWAEGGTVRVRSPLDLPLLLFVGWVLLSLPFATDAAYSFAEWRKLVTKVLVFYWALLVLSRARAEAGAGWVVAAVVLGATLMSAYALGDFVLSGGSWRDRQIRAMAPSSDYNWLSTYLVIAIPLLLVGALGAPDRRLRPVCWVALAVTVAGQVFTYTRAGWLALLAQGMAFGLFTGRRKLAAGVLVVGLALGVGFVASSKVGYHQVTVSSETWDYRLALWRKGVEEIAAHPLVGVGYGNETFAKRYGGHPVTGGPAGLHNLFLMVALGSGIPALAFLLWTLGAAIKSLAAGAAGAGGDPRALLMVGVAVMITGLAVRNLFDYMFAGAVAYLFWILTAAGLAQVGALRPACRATEQPAAA